MEADKRESSAILPFFWRFSMPEIRIRRRLSSRTFSYQIEARYGETIRKGRAQMVCKPVSAFHRKKAYPTDDIYDNCLRLGLVPEWWIGHLRMFYPNGDAPEHHWMRNGVGARVFSEIVKDLAAADGHLLYALPTTVAMRNFLIKHRFSPSLQFPDQFFGRIDLPEKKGGIAVKA